MQKPQSTTERNDKNLKILIACSITMLAVSTVFMTQSIFLEISEAFSIDITQARFSFSVVSLFYAASFFFIGPAVDKFSLPMVAITGLFLLIGKNVPKKLIGSASSLYILFCIGGGSLSSIILDSVWNNFEWSGITIACSFSILTTLLLMILTRGKTESRIPQGF